MGTLWRIGLGTHGNEFLVNGSFRFSLSYFSAQIKVTGHSWTENAVVSSQTRWSGGPPQPGPGAAGGAAALLGVAAGAAGGAAASGGGGAVGAAGGGGDRSVVVPER